MIYLEIIKNTIKRNLEYRSAVYLRLLNRVLMLFIQISIWKALYGGKTAESEKMLQVMLAYSVISSAIGVFTSSSIMWKLEGKIRSGGIATDLIKPVSIKGWLYAENIGEFFK